VRQVDLTSNTNSEGARVQRESPSGSKREEQPPRTVQRTMDREQTTPEVVQTQRESGFR
jgi:hypothetical protein